MLLKIDFNEDQVVYNEDGRIILDLKYYSKFSIGLHLVTVKGHTVEDFKTNDSLKHKSLFVGQKGGISIES